MLSKEDSEKNGAETAVKSRDCLNTVTILFGETAELSTDPNEEDVDDAKKMSGDGKTVHCDDHLTPAERIQDFNQYLANMSEHYDIPKVGPG
uniref:Uncharacterized protein n=1 Tax=Quercus lobata TaxID=97700 RepID=A0A7N2LT36_QUELO